MKALVVGESARRFALDVASALHLGWSEATVEEARTTEDALGSIASYSPQILVINGAAEAVNWLGAVRQIRAITDAVIIVIAEDFDEGDLIEAVEAGADDYLQVPLQRALFVARIRSAIRRVHGWRHGGSQTATCGGLTIDPERYEASVNGTSLRLTPTEFQILFQLTRRSGVVTRSEELFRTVWHDESQACGATLRKHIQLIRNKLASCEESRTAIVTVPGVGYKLVNEDEPRLTRLRVG